MAEHANSTRRSFLKALGFAAAGATVSTVAVAEVAGSPSFSVSSEVMDAIQQWRDADRKFGQFYDEVVKNPVAPWRRHEPNPAERDLFRAQSALTQAHKSMLLALRRG